MKTLALTIVGPDGEPVTINAPSGVPTGGTDIVQTITANGLTLFFAIAVILVLFYLILGGIQWAMSGGDKQKVATARNRLTYAIIGLVIIFLSIFIVNLILFIFGQKTI